VHRGHLETVAGCVLVQERDRVRRPVDGRDVRTASSRSGSSCASARPAGQSSAQ
jgi:hypothetical protein